MRIAIRSFSFSRRLTAAAAVMTLAGLGAAAAQSSRPEAPRPSYGTSSPILYHVGYPEFAPESSASLYSLSQSADNRGWMSPAANPTTFDAHPHLPSGALLQSLELDFCDTNAGGHRITLNLLECGFEGASCAPIGTVDSTMLTPPGCGFNVVDLTALNYTLLNNYRELILTATLTSGDSSNVLNGAYIGYTLQVSPPPGTATFSDVPTTSPQFKFVEALVAAGITAGCGGGNYCPNAPITRGQMAVFLASALGLHFPN